MKILVTGSEGFVGKNLTINLKNIMYGKNKTRPGIIIDEIYEYDLKNTEEELENYCKNSDFVFNLAGVNRPKDKEEFMKGNFGFASKLLETLKKYNNKCPVMLSSSIQATLTGRFEGSEYGKSKKAGEEIFYQYGEETGAKVLIYRFPNIVGKWIKPGYNSAVGTFCHNIANELPVTVNDENTELEMLFVDDLVEEMFNALENRETRDEMGMFCIAKPTYKATLGYIVKCLNTFHDMQKTLVMPEMPEGSFEKKLYSMYVSYLPKEKIIFPLKMNIDDRGSFTEVFKTLNCGQLSVNITKPGVTKGEHWHNSKWEMFIVVSGTGIIRERKIGTDEIMEFEVSGDNLQALQMLPGYTHSITNTSKTEDLVTLMWANEQFDREKPDTYGEKV